MGMNVCNIRILPVEARIETSECGWHVVESSNLTEEDLINYLVKCNIDILERENRMAKSGKSYLINKGIEMLVGVNDSYINIIEFRISLSWIEEGLSECFEVLKTIETYMPIMDWRYDFGEKLTDLSVFVNNHMEFIKEKKILFDKGYSEIRGMRLLESEIHECYAKRNRRVFKFKRRLASYRKINTREYVCKGERIN